MWFYSQTSGIVRHDAEFCAVGYSGSGACKDQPLSQDKHNLGPIPQGRYQLQPPKDTPTHGSYAIPLAPSLDNKMFGRSGFMIHGDSILHPGTASEGCIILSHEARMKMWESGDRDLEVTA